MMISEFISTLMAAMSFIMAVDFYKIRRSFSTYELWKENQSHLKSLFFVSRWYSYSFYGVANWFKIIPAKWARQLISNTPGFVIYALMFTKVNKIKTPPRKAGLYQN